jgi:low affinity Fe/Cu permease
MIFLECLFLGESKIYQHLHPNRIIIKHEQLIIITATTIYLILSLNLFFSAVAIYRLAKKLKEVLEENKRLLAKNDELRGFLSTMNSELDSKDAELAQDHNSLVGVKYRTLAEIRANQRLMTM